MQRGFLHHFIDTNLPCSDKINFLCVRQTFHMAQLTESTAIAWTKERRFQKGMSCSRVNSMWLSSLSVFSRPWPFDQ